MEKPRFIIEYSRDALKNLETLTKAIKVRIKDAIDKKLTTYPLEFGKPLRDKLIRVGDYRIVYLVHEEQVLVMIVEIDHRKDVYG
jgi:mRNA interferase RelE/StbE